jgi:hypothetical protein
MKRIITIAAIIITTAFLTSCSKASHVKITYSGIFNTLISDKRDLASGD